MRSDRVNVDKVPPVQCIRVWIVISFIISFYSNVYIYIYDLLKVIRDNEKIVQLWITFNVMDLFLCVSKSIVDITVFHWLKKHNR